MTLNPEDPRVRKTKRGLRNAFIHLIMQRGYDSISIQDIATEAETARITFYRHYRDKEELLEDCLNTLYEDLAQKTERISPERLRQGYSPVQVLYDHIEEHEDLYRILFSSRGTQTVIERMRHHLATHAQAGILQRLAENPLVIPIDIAAYHIASAQIGLAIWWLDHDKPYPSQYMAQTSVWLSLVGLLNAIGIHEYELPAPQKPD